MLRASMALDRYTISQQRNGRPSFWERPSRAARPERYPAGGVTNRPAGGPSALSTAGRTAPHSNLIATGRCGS
jgi:hypothetical protein